jgi:hypothetical protein
MSRGKAKAESADRRGGTYFLLPACLITSAAWREASPLSIKLLMALCARHTGFNNGRISLSAREAAAAVGSKNFHAISRSFGELEALGLAVLAKDRPKCERMAREYRLTFVGVGEAPATNDYLQWSLGDAGTRKKRASPTAAETNLSVEATATARKVSVEAAAADRGKFDRIGHVSAEDGSTHISNHGGVFAVPSSSGGEKATDPRGFAFGLISRAGVISAAPPIGELRERVLAHLNTCGRGAQSRLAAQAGIPGGTFSKFLRSGGPLSAQARLRLTCSLPKMAAAERKHERVIA